MNEIKVLINFKEEKNIIYGTKPITGDYNSTKLVFTFEDNPVGTKVLKIRPKESNDPVYIGEIDGNEVILTSVDANEKNHSIFTEAGIYILEVALYNGDSKLTSVYSEFLVNKEQIEISDEVVEGFLPIFDELLADIDSAITDTNNLDISVSKLNKTTDIALTKKDGTTKQVQVLDGKDGVDGAKGEPFTYEDFTPEQLEALTGPAGKDGLNGVDGFSPSASISQSGDTTTISITDKNGTTTASIDLSNKLNTSKVKSSLSTTNGDVYDVIYINSLIGNINTILATLTTPSNGGNE